ncbi:MAG TPA: EAL domain-containing response regulator [Polyangiaceae bacterium]|jgi:EAL domain-containing protein (putative c-di-GMP-specific phosphodiesterase class I)
MISVSPAQDAIKQVLLVDDELSLLRVTARVLARDDYRIVCARSGEEAATQLASQHFDVVVSDIHMPGMNGLQLLRMARDFDSDVQIVLITGNPDIGSAAAAVEFGAFQYLTKPVGGEHLRTVVELAINASRAARLKREFIEMCGSGTYRVGDRAGIESVLDRALASLWMAYQPIVSAQTHALFACEALMRTEERALPNPGAVLDAAQRTERLRELGRQVRGRVAADLLQTDPGDVLCFVNLCAEDLLDPQLLSPESALSRLATRVVLEITERASLSQIDGVLERIARLRGLGYRIAIDDLGAGYAGLSSFTQLDPDFVKLDMSLVRDVHESATKRRLISAMVELCHDMDKLIVAEGVETHAERLTLESLGCDLLQGYLFAKPERGLAPALRRSPAA